MVRLCGISPCPDAICQPRPTHAVECVGRMRDGGRRCCHPCRFQPLPCGPPSGRAWSGERAPPSPKPPGGSSTTSPTGGTVASAVMSAGAEQNRACRGASATFTRGAPDLPRPPGLGQLAQPGLEDPAEAEGTDDQRLGAFRQTRQELTMRLRPFTEIARWPAGLPVASVVAGRWRTSSGAAGTFTLPGTRPCCGTVARRVRARQ